MFSPDSKRVAYAAMRDGKRFVVFDGMEGKPYDGIHEGAFVFSPDSRHMAYLANQGDTTLVVVDGVEVEGYDNVVRGSRLVFDSPTRLHFLGLRRQQIFRVQVQLYSGGTRNRTRLRKNEGAGKRQLIRKSKGVEPNSSTGPCPLWTALT